MKPVNEQSAQRGDDFARLFRALCDPTRRRVLEALRYDDPRQAEEFVTKEFRPEGLSRKTAAVELHHFHLPYLDGVGFIDWEEETGRITRDEAFREVRQFLEVIDDHQEELPGDWP